MDWDKLKFTKLEEEILNFLFRNPTSEFNGKELAKEVKASQTAVAKSIKSLFEKNIINLKKKILLSIRLNREDEDIFILKRIYNLKNLYSSELVNELSKNFKGGSISVFGSYASGEDTEDSDIDIAIIDNSKKKIEDNRLLKYEKKLQRNISLHFFKDLKSINSNLRNNIINGIILKGALTL
jgi:predicted nucleotidyltransferase